MGSYECVCDAGFEMQDNKCVKSKDKECRKGFERKDGQCVGEISIFSFFFLKNLEVQIVEE